MSEPPPGELALSPYPWPDLPPGQHLTSVLPTVQLSDPPTIPLREWTFTVVTEAGVEHQWDWPAFCTQPTEHFLADLHCVLGWSAVDVPWEGVPVQRFLGGFLDGFLDGTGSSSPYAQICGDDGYVTTLPTEDLTEMPTWLAVRCNGERLTRDHGAPMRLLVPHLYGWKSVKWVRRIVFTAEDSPGTRERDGYHAYGDPWRQQRRRLTPRGTTTANPFEHPDPEESER